MARKKTKECCCGDMGCADYGHMKYMGHLPGCKKSTRNQEYLSKMHQSVEQLADIFCVGEK